MELKNTEKQEHSVVALTIEITKAEFEAAKDKAFMIDYAPNAKEMAAAIERTVNERAQEG